MATFSANEEQVGGRLDVAAANFLSSLSRASIQKLCSSGKILVNGQPAKPSYKLSADDKIEINYNPLENAKIPEITLPIIYQDEDCLVIDKPPGLLAHSKGAFNPEATVATFLSKYWTGALVKPARHGEINSREGIVHRLDRATSGVMICAKNPQAMGWLQKQFSSRRVKKTYIAIASGQFKELRATIDMPIERNPKKPQTFRTGNGGKASTTEYEVIKSSQNLSLVKLLPRTGRTHQLRVHLSKIGHPILGDNLYGGQPAERLFLHALCLEITLPSHQRKIFNASQPSEFERTMKNDG